MMKNTLSLFFQNQIDGKLKEKKKERKKREDCFEESDQKTNKLEQ